MFYIKGITLKICVSNEFQKFLGIMTVESTWMWKEVFRVFQITTIPWHTKSCLWTINGALNSTLHFAESWGWHLRRAFGRCNPIYLYSLPHNTLSLQTLLKVHRLILSRTCAFIPAIIYGVTSLTLFTLHLLHLLFLTTLSAIYHFPFGSICL